MSKPNQNTAHMDAMAAFAEETATQVRDIALRWFRRPFDILTKTDESPVTIADRAVEEAIREAILRRFPDHGIIGEEFGISHADSEFVWSIDPIDGTRSFISGSPLWGTLIGLLHYGKPVLGLIDIPCTSERWVGISQRGSSFADAACRTRDTISLDRAILYTTSPDSFSSTEEKALERLSSAVYLRRFGGDCYSYGLLACGHIDLVLETGLQPYDFLALVPIIEEAGGVITDWLGLPLTAASGGQVLASANPDLHEKALMQIQV